MGCLRNISTTNIVFDVKTSQLFIEGSLLTMNVEIVVLNCQKCLKLGRVGLSWDELGEFGELGELVELVKNQTFQY